MSRASAQLNLTRTAVSHGIQLIENELNVKLFERSKTGVSPTEAGLRLYKRVRPILQDLQQIEDEFKSSHAQRHKIVIATTHTFAKTLILPVIADIIDRFPGVSIQFKTGSLSDSVGAVRNGTGDLALTLGFQDDIAPAMAGLEHHEVGLIEEVFVCDRSLLKKITQQHAGKIESSKALTLLQISELPLITLPRDSWSFESYRKHFERNNAPLKPKIEVHQLDIALDLIKKKMGAGIVYRLQLDWEHALGNTELVEIPCKTPLQPKKLLLSYEKHGRKPLPREFLNQLEILIRRMVK